VNSFTALSIYALNLIIAIGLGLAIDYSLFMVSRYREELERLDTPQEALRETLATAGRTVAFSAFTVAAALASMLIFPEPFLYSMGVGGILVALLSASVALIVLPAVLALLGPRVNALAPARWKRAAERTARAEGEGFWYRLSHLVMRRPGAFAAGSAALLILIGIPFLGIKFIGVDPTILPKSASAHETFTLVNTTFPPNRTSPIYIAIRAPSSAAAQVQAYAQRLRSLPGAAAVQPPQPVGGGYWRVDVVSKTTYLEKQSQTLVRDIRRINSGFPTYVGGDSASFIDTQDSLAANLPYALAIIAATTLVLLFLMTGSLILPFKTLVMNALTVSAVFGLLVLIFQDGRLESVLRYTGQGALNSTQPLLIGAVVFALSTDYGVFLLTRIKEARDQGLSNDDAIARGLERTGRIVTAAALLFCVAVGAFASSKIVFIKEIGLGLALGVIIDATLVRGLLVPSLMKLLGDWNWWAPEPLRRLHARIGLRESAEPTTPASRPAGR
jgi:RND superfamily putative drug exporter